MSDIQDLRGNIELKKIEAPSLTQSNYGKNIREKFDNIDDNLRRLANRDFVAGKAGKDIKFAKYSLWSNNDFTDLGKAFVQAIVGDEPIDWEHDWNPDYEQPSNSDFTDEFYNTHTSLRPIKVKFFDYFIENPDITIMYQLDDHEASDEETNRILICSPYVYTFIDQRYAILGDYTPSNPDAYSGLEDSSCLLNLTYDGENPQLERINQFPTLYYDGGGQFRWKLYGSESGILATGPKGTNAFAAPITFARLSDSSTGDNTAPETSTATISQILVIEGGTAMWKEVSTLKDDELPNVGDPVMAYRPMTSQGAQDPALIGDPTEDPNKPYGQPYTVYFTKVVHVERDAKVIIVCDASSTSVQFLVNNTMLDSMLKTVIDGSMGTSCLYIPSIGSLDDFDDSSIVHAVIGTQASISGESHYYLTLKPIKYGEVHKNPDKVSAVDKSKLIIDYRDVEVKGTLLTQNLNVSKDATIENKLKSKNIEVTDTLTAKVIKVGTDNRYTKIGTDLRDSSRGDIIEITSKTSSLPLITHTTILSSEGINTGSVTANTLSVKSRATISGGATIDGNAKVSNTLTVSDRILFENNGTSGGVGISIIEIEKKEGVNRRLDIIAEELHLSEGGSIVSSKAIINSANLSLERRDLYPDSNDKVGSCDVINSKTYTSDEGNEIYYNIWILKETEKICQVLHFNEGDHTGLNAVAIPATYPAWSTVMVLFTDNNNGQTFNFIKGVYNNKLIRASNNDIGYAAGAMYFITLGGDDSKYMINGHECRSIDKIYEFGAIQVY